MVNIAEIHNSDAQGCKSACEDQLLGLHLYQVIELLKHFKEEITSSFLVLL